MQDVAEYLLTLKHLTLALEISLLSQGLTKTSSCIDILAFICKHQGFSSEQSHETKLNWVVDLTS